MSNPSEVAALVTATNNLTQTVIDTRSQITSTVATKIAELDAWKAALGPADIPAEPRYHSVIDLTGLPTDRFYPVWWRANATGYGPQHLSIERYYSDDQALNPFGTGGAHIASLLLEIEMSDYPWGGGANFMQVKRLSQTYRKTVRQIRFRMKGISVGPVPGHTQATWANSPDCPSRSGLYLRGGLTYQAFRNQLLQLHYSREHGQVEVYSEVRAGGAQGSGRWMAQSHDINDEFLGPDYDDFHTPYNAFPYDV